MSKTQEVQKAMLQALKEHQSERKETLSLLLSALKAKAKDKRSELTEEEENTIVLKELKQTKETMDSAPESRQELIEQCRNRMEILAEFAPKQLGEEEIRDTVRKLLEQLGLSQPTAKEKGVIMKSLMPLVSGKADGAVVNRIVGEFLK